MLDKTQSELFLNRVGLVLEEELRNLTDQQFEVLISGLESLLRNRTPDQITDEMIQGSGTSRSTYTRRMELCETNI